MTHDDTFRLVLLISIAVMLPVAACYRIRSQLTREKLDRRQEGWFLMVRPLALVWVGGMIAWLIDPEWMNWSAVPLPVWLRWAGVGLGVASFVLTTWTFHTLGPNLTDTVVTRKNAYLVTNGPYRYVRHPFYVSFLIAVVANGLTIANWFIGGLGLVAWLMLRARTALEEERLVARFGDDYRRYMERTGRFFPRRAR
jgi:protein-S-isoprenylcysteine O-methyltransferase Ste14